jgi:membrane protease subunit HflC
MISRALLVVAALFALAVFVLASSLYVVGEGEQALLVRLGAPIGVASEPGLGSRRRSSTACSSTTPAC